MKSDTTHLLETAMAAHRRGDAAAADAGYRAVLAKEPGNAQALQLLGDIMSRSDPEAGIALIARSLSINPDSKEAHLNLANALARSLRMSEAEKHFREAYNRDRDNADAASGLGGALLHLGDYAHAEPYLREALNRAPTAPTVLLNMAMLMEATARFEDALGYYGRVLELYPDHAGAHQHRGLALLLRGRFREGWPEYAWRVKAIPTFFGRFKYPYWRGEALAGRKVLVWTEQGPGEETLLATMLPEMLAMGGEIVLLCSPRMAPLFARSFPSARVIPMGQKPSDPAIMAGIDFQASFGELGAVLRPDFSAFPAGPMPLKADPTLTATLRQRYHAAARGNALVGISWRSKNVRLETTKTVLLDEWNPILACPGVTFVNLQYGRVKDDLTQIQREGGPQILLDETIDPLSDLDTFAAQVAAMDAVISVSNTTVHMAGALGRPTWALVPSNHGRLWYWFLERKDSPWYPSVRLFRQDSAQGWAPPIAAIAQKLTEWRNGGGHIGTPSRIS